MKNNVGFVCFGEVNTPYERLQIKHDAALKSLGALDAEIIDAGVVIDDPASKTARDAVSALKKKEIDSLIVCVAGWVPTHAVIRVTDEFRALPMVLWDYAAGWKTAISLPRRIRRVRRRCVLRWKRWDIRSNSSIT